MKPIWVYNIPYKKEIVTTALENGAQGIIVEKQYVKTVKELGRILVISKKNGDLLLDKDVVFMKVNSKNDEQKAIRLSYIKIVVVETSDCKTCFTNFRERSFWCSYKTV